MTNNIRKDVLQLLRTKLIQIIRSEIATTPQVAVCFSGSLDSSLVAFMIKKFTSAQVKLYTIGFPGCYDYEPSIRSAALLGLKCKFISLSENMLDPNLKEYQELTSDTDKVSMSYTLPFYILMKNIQEKTIATGHGADTLFGGFYRYLKIPNVKEEIRNSFKEFTENLDKREYKIAKHFNKKLILPFANKELSEYVLKMPKEYFIKNGERKVMLRRVAEAVGLPKSIVDQPKKAMQYSTGTMKRLEKLWKQKPL